MPSTTTPARRATTRRRPISPGAARWRSSRKLLAHRPTPREVGESSAMKIGRDADTIARQRAALRQEYGELFDRIAAALFEADPIHINFETNTDEYEPEAETILPRLHTATTVDDVERIVHEEFCRRFDAGMAGQWQKRSGICGERSKSGRIELGVPPNAA